MAKYSNYLNDEFDKDEILNEGSEITTDYKELLRELGNLYL